MQGMQNIFDAVRFLWIHFSDLFTAFLATSYHKLYAECGLYFLEHIKYDSLQYQIQLVSSALPNIMELTVFMQHYLLSSWI